jgi:hypothetical protein
MKKIILTVLLCFCQGLLNAQIPAYKNSVRVALSTTYVKGDNRRQSPVLNYALIYSHQLGNSRWLAETGFSYSSRYVQEQITPFQFLFPGDRSQLVTADFTFLYNLLKSNRHALRIGAGPSFWYAQNGLLENIGGIVGPNGQVMDIVFIRKYSHDINLAVNGRADYSYAFTPRIILGVRVATGGNVFQPDARGTLFGSLSTVGLSAGYRF